MALFCHSMKGFLGCRAGKCANSQSCQNDRHRGAHSRFSTGIPHLFGPSGNVPSSDAMDAAVSRQMTRASFYGSRGRNSRNIFGFYYADTTRCVSNAHRGQMYRHIKNYNLNE